MITDPQSYIPGLVICPTVVGSVCEICLESAGHRVLIHAYTIGTLYR